MANSKGSDLAGWSRASQLRVAGDGGRTTLMAPASDIIIMGVTVMRPRSTTGSRTPGASGGFVNFITKRVAIGNYLEAQDPDFLAAKGFKSVLCLIGCPANVSAKSLGVDAFEVYPLVDGAGNDARLIRFAIDDLARLVRDHPPVLVHCHAGVSRSVAVVAGYMMLRFRKTAADAFAAVEKRRVADVAPELRALIERLDLAGH